MVKNNASNIDTTKIEKDVKNELDDIIKKRLKNLKYFKFYYWIIFILINISFFTFLIFLGTYKYSLDDIIKNRSLEIVRSLLYLIFIVISLLVLGIWFFFYGMDLKNYREQEKCRKNLLYENFYEVTQNYKKIWTKEKEFFLFKPFRGFDILVLFLYFIIITGIELDYKISIESILTKRDYFFEYFMLFSIPLLIWILYKGIIYAISELKNNSTDLFSEKEKRVLLTSDELLKKENNKPWKFFLGSGKWIYRMWISKKIEEFLDCSFSLVEKNLEKISENDFNEILEEIKRNSKYTIANDVVTDINNKLREKNNDYKLLKKRSEKILIFKISKDFFKEKLKETIDKKNLKIACFQTQMYKQDLTNAYVLGSSGSGKTSKIIVPTIIANANAKIQPSFFISDPKNELYQKLSEYLKNLGYVTYLLNLNDLTNSNKWNPLKDIYEKFLAKGLLALFVKQYSEYVGQDRKIKLSEFCFSKDEINDEIKNKMLKDLTHLDFKKDSENEHQILFDDSKFITINELKQYLNWDLDAQITELIDILSKNLFNNKNKDNLVELARRILEGGLYNLGYLVEKSVTEKTNFISIEKFNIFSLMSLINENGFLNNFFEKINNKELEILNEKFDENKIKDKKLELKILKSRSDYTNLLPIWKSSEEAKELIFRTLNIIMKPLIGNGIKGLTSYNEISLREISYEEKPAAIFLGLDVVNDNYHPFATLFINLLHNRISTKAKNSEKQKLKNGFMFILEEFGNLPAIPGYENILTTCRSENIKFMSIVQSNNQLNNKYDKEIILGNSDLKVFLKTSSESDIKWISEVIGKKETKFRKIKKFSNNDIKDIESGNPWHFNIVIADNKKFLMRLRPWFVELKKDKKPLNSSSDSKTKNIEIYSTSERVLDYFDWKDNINTRS